MKIVNNYLDKAVIDELLGGAVVALRTDTVYGLIAQANSKNAVEKVYHLKKRSPEKSPIILVSSLDDHPGYTDDIRKIYERLSLDRPTSIIIPVENQPEWLTRGRNTLAYRIPNIPELIELIKITGPLIAPSANLEGQPPARTVSQAVEYFGDKVKVYVDGGEVPKDTSPSRLIQYEAGAIKFLR